MLLCLSTAGQSARLQSPGFATAPLGLAALAVACGIFLARHLQRPANLWGLFACVLIACTLIALYIRNALLARVTVLLGLICAGAFTVAWTPSPRIITPPDQFLSGQRVIIAGYISNDASLLAGGSRERFDVQSETIQLDGDNATVQLEKQVGIRLSVFLRGSSLSTASAQEENVEFNSSGQFPPLHYGDRVSLTAKLRPPHNFRNPGSFDYEGYLRGLGIVALGSADADSIVVLPGQSGTIAGRLRSRIRRSILKHINSPDHALWKAEDAALFAAMIVGDDSLLGRNVREEFQQTGVYHLLVVSGMNVGILAFAVFFLARWLRVPDWAASLLTIGLSSFYAFIAGMGIPIQRAVLMLSVFLLARLFFRQRAALNATGFAALVVLIWSPAALFEAGFQLTFLALLAIAGISLPLLQRTSNRYRVALINFGSTAYDLTLDPRIAQLRLDLRLIIARLSRLLGLPIARWLVLGLVQAILAIFELLVVSTITQAVLVAPMRSYFHRATLIGMPANILVLPLAGVMLNAGVLAIALSYIFTPLAELVAIVASACLHWTLVCLRWLAHFPVSQWRAPDLNVWLWLVAMTGILMGYFAVRQTRKLATLCGLTGLFATALLVAMARPQPDIHPGVLEITAIDVGQGDSLLVVSPQGKTMLIDGGGSIGPLHGDFDYGEDVVSPYLWARGIYHLDVVVLTHAHGDHIGGLPRIVENFSPTELWLGINPETMALKKLRDAASLHHTSVHKHVMGDHLNLGGADIRVLSPPPDWQPRLQPKNDDSLALLVSFGHTSALLTGDLERKMETFVAKEDVHADLLKVAHHGSATSTTPELLAAVQPKFAIISDGFRNPFGHPRAAVLERLQNAHIRTYRTDLLGVVNFWLDGTQVTARPASLGPDGSAPLLQALRP
jgi:competence protein ComEC